MKKRCGMCLRYKFFTEYTKAKSRPLGIYDYCKQCMYEYRRKDDGRLLKYYKKFNKDNPDYFLQWRRKHGIQERRKAINSGMKICTICNTEKYIDEFFTSRIEPFKKESQCKICRTKIMMDYHYRTRIYRKKFVFETGEKKCNMCFEIKDIDDFYRQKDNRKGYYYHYYICKECWAIYLKKYRGSIGIEYKKEKILYTCSLCNNEFAEKEMIKLFNDDKFICVNCNPSNHIEESLQGIFV